MKVVASVCLLPRKSAPWTCKRPMEWLISSSKMKRLRYSAQFFAVPAGAGMMNRATAGMKRAFCSAACTHAGSRLRRSAISAPKRITSSRWP